MHMPLFSTPLSYYALTAHRAPAHSWPHADPAHLEGGSEEAALEHRAPPRGRICSGQGQRGVSQGECVYYRCNVDVYTSGLGKRAM